MKTKIYLTRHGQTEWNVEGRLQGHLNSDLTETGLKHAKQLSERLENVNFDAIYSSPSGRAFQTAGLLNTKNQNIIQSEDLMEMSFGTWEGELMKYIESTEPEALNHLFNDATAYASETGEDFYSLFERVQKFMTELMKTHQGESVLIVSHGITSKAILTYMEGRDLNTFWEGPFIQGCSLSLIESSGPEMEQVNVLLHGDTSHLQSFEEL